LGSAIKADLADLISSFFMYKPISPEERIVRIMIRDVLTPILFER
jgi:hypothetical protein